MKARFHRLTPLVMLLLTCAVVSGCPPEDEELLQGTKRPALSTRRPERLGEVADRYGVRRRYTDYHQLLDDPSVEQDRR